MNKRLTKISKYLSFVLKHHPDAIGLKPDPWGWINIEELVANADANGKSITAQQVKDVVAQSEVQRFLLSDDGLSIRAC
ncbi:RNA 2'-phosphotransferase [Stieleria varia]|uniref:RNA 2'-phosphotransferase n=1 Tax=Stieleria varia TaxID=2528005 RepID=A0A5C6B7U7_9BACT|nr:RNA 2'-phosphotransferase [Stieleria varia]TWU08335.1 RNA 2'-phosphotransferase [Stieleria varia]